MILIRSPVAFFFLYFFFFLFFCIVMMASSVSQTPLYLALQFILNELETSAYFKIKAIHGFLLKGYKDCLLTPTICLCTAAKYENKSLSHLHSPLNAMLDSETELLYIACMMWTWWQPLKAFKLGCCRSRVCTITFHENNSIGTEHCGVFIHKNIV